MSWDNICRTCSTSSTNLESIYSSPDPLALEYEYSETYSQMIQSITSIHIEPNDKLPQKICQKCVDNLLNAFNFQKVAIKTEEALRSLQPPEIILIKEETKNEPIVKSNNKIKIKNIKTLQKQHTTNGIKRKLVKVPLVAPPPLISLSESKVTPPPLVFLPKRPKKSSQEKTPKEEIPCKYCNIKLASEFLHKVHLLSHEIKLYHLNVCPFCDQQPRDLMKHLREHYKYTTCTNCKMKFYTIAKYENHMRSEHNKYIPQ